MFRTTQLPQEEKLLEVYEYSNTSRTAISIRLGAQIYLFASTDKFCVPIKRPEVGFAARCRHFCIRYIGFTAKCCSCEKEA